LNTSGGGDATTANMPGEGVKGPQASTNSERHRKDSLTEGTESGTPAGTPSGAEEDLETSKDQAGADEVDDITSAFTKLSTV